jgi:predicted helicase
MGGEYQPFDGICLTDTFQLHEKEDLVSDMLQVNSGRRKKQKALDIRVIIGNPPYSSGQNSANDNNANVAYPKLDESIRSTYAAHSNATNKNALYDSYIRAIRWASNRIKDTGVIGFVSNAGFIEANTADGLRKCLAEEFSSIYVFHLRGNQRTSGELSRREGGKIFGGGSRTPIAISILVKNPLAKEHGKIMLHDIGDYLSRDDKLTKITELHSINGITVANGWQTITPDQHNDWVGQRDDSFGEFISLGDKKDDKTVTVFENYSSGIKTNRDAWCYNASKSALSHNMQGMVSFYNAEVKRYQTACSGLSKEQYPNVDGFINTDSTKISWNRGLKNDLARHIQHPYQSEAITVGLYRPFTKSIVYFSKYYNDMVYQMPRIFPDSTVENRVICVTGRGETVSFSALMTNALPNLHTIASGQCFPLYLYEKSGEASTASQHDDLFAQPVVATAGYTRKDGITDAGLLHFQTAYPGESISKSDVFYYIYGLLHSEEYKQRYADNLSKELPRIPAVKKFADFKAFSDAGRKLAELHIGYESIAPYPVTIEGGALLLSGFADDDYRVTQMKFASKADKTRVIYNHKITMTDIPLEAYDYVVNGKPALEWVMERQAVTTHKDSGIVNDANLWATETMHDAAYPLKLFQRVITVSLETMKIVKSLPKLDI